MIWCAFPPIINICNFVSSMFPGAGIVHCSGVVLCFLALTSKGNGSTCAKGLLHSLYIVSSSDEAAAEFIYPSSSRQKSALSY